MQKRCADAVAFLDRLEAPYPPPSSVIDAVERGLDELNRYPASLLLDQLVAELAKYSLVDRGAVVVAGSRREALRAALLGLVETKKRLLRIALPFPGLMDLRRIVEPFAERLVEIRLVRDEDSWRLPWSTVYELLGGIDALVIDNPNDPTGSLLVSSLSDAKRVVEEACSKGVVVLIDESFYEFSGLTLSSLVERYPCLIILRSMEQAYALAGLGLAYLIASEETVTRLARIASIPSKPSLLAGLAALRSQSYYLGMVEKVVAERERIRQLLLGMENVVAYRSHAGFILVDTGLEKAVEKLCSRRVAVAETPLGTSYVRVTVGTQTDNNYFLAALTRLLSEESKLV